MILQTICLSCLKTKYELLSKTYKVARDLNSMCFSSLIQVFPHSSPVVTLLLKEQVELPAPRPPLSRIPSQDLVQVYVLLNTWSPHILQPGSSAHPTCSLRTMGFPRTQHLSFSFANILNTHFLH